MQSVRLPQSIHAEIIAHAREGKPEEICGVLRGRGLEAYELFRGQNMAEERIENYEVDPRTLLLQFKFMDNDDEMMGVYHSHQSLLPTRRPLMPGMLTIQIASI